MNLDYKILFTVEILHDYYSSKLCNDFEIIPAQATATLLRNQGMIWRVVGNKLLVAVNTGNDAKPLVDFSNEKKLSFYLKLRNVNFGTITNIEYSLAGRKRFYFSNRSQNEGTNSLYLHVPVPAYDGTTTYLPGALATDSNGKMFSAIKGSRKKLPADPGETAHDLTETDYWEPAIQLYNDDKTYPPYSYAADSGGDVFMALLRSDKTNKHPLSETNYWLPAGKIQYVTGKDLLELSPVIYKFTTTLDTDFTINVFGLDLTGNTYDKQVLDTVTLSYDDPQTTVPVKLQGLPPGKYKLVVNGDEKEIYLDDVAVYDNIFGIIEIFNHLAGTDHFSLLQAGALKEPSFLLHFDNRAAIWKYLARTADVTSIQDSSSTYTFTSSVAKEFESDVPIPFSEQPISTLLLQSVRLGDIKPVANPGINRLGRITRDGDTYYCAETYLNY